MSTKPGRAQLQLPKGRRVLQIDISYSNYLPYICRGPFKQSCLLQFIRHTAKLGVDVIIFVIASLACTFGIACCRQSKKWSVQLRQSRQ